MQYYTKSSAHLSLHPHYKNSPNITKIVMSELKIVSVIPKAQDHSRETAKFTLHRNRMSKFIHNQKRQI